MSGRKEFRIDLTNMKFDRLTVKKYAGRNTHNENTWLCDCKCGNQKIITGQNLRSGKTKSCGCLQKERTLKTHTSHGDTNTKSTYHRLYIIFNDMHARCENPNNKDFYTYGARDISVCDEWSDYKIFKTWALCNGYKNDLTIDRIDNNKGYSPKNCRWATTKQQNRNQSSTRFMTCDGKTLSLGEWAEIKNIKPSTLSMRVQRGWSDEKAITTPVHK